MADQLSNKTLVTIVFNDHNIQGYINNKDYSDWINGDYNGVLSLYKPTDSVFASYERFIKVNARNIDYIEEHRDEIK